MGAINLLSLQQLVEHKGPAATVEHLTECLAQKQLKPDDFSLRDLAEALVPDGREWVHSMRPGKGGYVELIEAGAVTSNYFSSITGQLVFTKIKEGFESEAFVFTPLIDSWQSDILTREKIPGLTGIGDDTEIVDEGQPYPYLGVSEDYTEVGEKRKRGGIVPVTREAIFADRTGMLLRQCAKIGEALGLNLEKRVIDAIIDENSGATSITAPGGHRYHWKGTSYATYQTTSPWDNVTASNALADYTDFQGALLTLKAIKDPYTSEPVMHEMTHVFVAPGLEWTARQIITATQVRFGDITSGAGTQTMSQNPVPNFAIVSSQLFADRLATDTDWFICNPKKAWAHVFNWGIETEQASPQHPMNFERDIIQQFKASIRDTVATIEPRATVKSTVA